MPRTHKKWIRNASDIAAVAEGCYFDIARAERVPRFIELFCVQSKGRWAGQPLELLPWQLDFVMRLFGWRRADGTRRFRMAYLEVAKKNGKSTLVSALAVYLLVADGEGAPEVYLNAVDREQAGIVFEEAARMVGASPELVSRLEVIRSKGRILDVTNNGKIQKNSADAPSKDGVSGSGIIFDEVHRFKNRDLWDVFRYAGLARVQPLTLCITTAGDEESGVWFELRARAEAINNGTRTDTEFLGVVYRASPDDDIESPQTWLKANPSLGTTLVEADFQADLESAKSNPAEMLNFLRLRLNIVSRAESGFVDLAEWDQCGAAIKLSPRSPVWMGLDLAEVEDLTALAMVGEVADGVLGVVMHFWLPGDNIVNLERRHQQPYRVWAQQGLITLTPGRVVDYSFVRAQINALAGDYDLRSLLVDPYNANKLAIELKEQDGLPVEIIRQGFLSLSDPTKQLLRLVRGRHFLHGGNPILRWHAANAVAEVDAAGNIKLSKKKSRRKIDGLAACVNAVAGYSAGSVDDGPSVYESRGLVSLSF